MSWTYVPGATPRDVARLIVRDTDPDNPFFEDEEWDAYLALESGDVRYAAADALETIASNQAMVLRITQVFDLKVDGVAAAKVLQAQAASLRQQADNEIEGQFAIAEQVWTSDAYAQRLWNERLRGIP